jgi:pyruvate dehydrogenase E2 component (dihydrolipoamide acetyltransferase)
MPTSVIMPQMGESIAEGTVTKWYKKVGDRVERDEPLFEISTDKVDTEIPSPAAGVLVEIKVPEGQTVPINTVVGVIDGEGAQPREPAAAATPVGAPAPKAAAAPPPPPSPVPPAARAAAPGAQELRSSPLVRRIARESGVELGQIQGSGLGGRITKQDILAFLEKRAASPAPPPAIEPPAPEPRPAAAAPSPVAPAAGYSGRIETVAMTAMRKSIAEHMILSRRTSAHVTTVFEVDLTRVAALRDDYRGRFEREEGVKLTFMPFFIRAVIGGLKAFPLLNASIDRDSILYKKELNIGLAVALDWGLIVPVIHRADEKSFLGLARAVVDLAERARAKKLAPADVQGGTFTITNPGAFGSLFGTPIINQPQVAILGIGGIHKRPVVVNDAIAVRSMVYLALSFDHRLIDGAVADQFMADVKGRLERWEEKIL